MADVTAADIREKVRCHRFRLSQQFLRLRFVSRTEIGDETSKTGTVVRTLSKHARAWVQFLALKTILLSLIQITALIFNIWFLSLAYKF